MTLSAIDRMAATAGTAFDGMNRITATALKRPSAEALGRSGQPLSPESFYPANPVHAVEIVVPGLSRAKTRTATEERMGGLAGLAG